MSTIVISGWILIIATTSGDITIVPTQYRTEEACKDAADSGVMALRAVAQYTCVKAGEGMHD